MAYVVGGACCIGVDPSMQLMCDELAFMKSSAAAAALKQLKHKVSRTDGASINL